MVASVANLYFSWKIYRVARAWYMGLAGAINRVALAGAIYRVALAWTIGLTRTIYAIALTRWNIPFAGAWIIKNAWTEKLAWTGTSLCSREKPVRYCHNQPKSGYYRGFSCELKEPPSCNLFVLIFTHVHFLSFNYFLTRPTNNHLLLF